MTWFNRIRASADNHLDALVAAAQTPKFWQRTMGNAVEASVYSAAIVSVDQLLVHRDALLNGSDEARKERLRMILQNSGLIVAGAWPGCREGPVGSRRKRRPGSTPHHISSSPSQ